MRRKVAVNQLLIPVAFAAEEATIVHGTQVASTGERIIGKGFPPSGEIKHFSGVPADLEFAFFVCQEGLEWENRHDASPLLLEVIDYLCSLLATDGVGGPAAHFGNVGGVFVQRSPDLF